MGVMETMMSQGAPGIKFEKIGDTVEGVIVDISERQDANYEDSTKLKWWNHPDSATPPVPGARPVMIPIFTLQTEIRDSEEDDGLRAVWCRGNIFSAVRDAIRGQFKGQKPTDEDVKGGTLKVRFDSLGEKKPKMNPPKLFRAKYTRRSIVDAPAQGDAQHSEASPPPADW